MLSIRPYDQVLSPLPQALLCVYAMRRQWPMVMIEDQNFGGLFRNFPFENL